MNLIIKYHGAISSQRKKYGNQGNPFSQCTSLTMGNGVISAWTEACRRILLKGLQEMH